jgi:hypothetical protein
MRFFFTFLCLGSSIFAFNNNDQMIKYLSDQIDFAYHSAENYSSDLPKSIFDIEGMSSKKNRIFLNTIGKISAVMPTNYLEIGVWKGSTFIAANYNNKFVKSVAVDDWSQFEGPRNCFLKNLKILANKNIKTLDNDCFSKEFFQKIQADKFDIYFYDGDHSELSQYYAFKKLDPFLDDVFIAIVDDWSWSTVKDGTNRAFTELGYEVIKKLDLNTNQSDPNGYWNGLLVALVRKGKSISEEL